jgi:hypothetical protein
VGHRERPGVPGGDLRIRAGDDFPSRRRSAPRYESSRVGGFGVREWSHVQLSDDPGWVGYSQAAPTSVRWLCSGGHRRPNGEPRGRLQGTKRGLWQGCEVKPGQRSGGHLRPVDSQRHPGLRAPQRAGRCSPVRRNRRDRHRRLCRRHDCHRLCPRAREPGRHELLSPAICEPDGSPGSRQYPWCSASAGFLEHTDTPWNSRTCSGSGCSQRMRIWRALGIPLLLVVASVAAGSCTSMPTPRAGKLAVAIPRGWRTYAYAATALSVPSRWTVVHDAVCPAASSSGTLDFGPAAYQSYGCPPREGAEVSVLPLPRGYNLPSSRGYKDSLCPTVKIHGPRIYVGPCGSSDAAGSVRLPGPGGVPSWTSATHSGTRVPGGVSWSNRRDTPTAGSLVSAPAQ